jgi:hypothetical protein
MPETRFSQDSQWDGVDRRGQLPPPQAGIKFDATVNLGHILTFVGFIVAGFTAWTTVDKRVTILEERTALQHLIDKQQDATQANNIQQIRESLADIKQQIHRIAERKP